MKIYLFFISFLLLPYLTQLTYVPNCGSFPLQNVLKPPIHVAAIIESDAGILGTINHAFLFLQIHCALYEHHSHVQIDGWKVDNEYKTCTNINTQNPTENIIQAAAFSSPPEHSRTLCEILEVAKECAKEYNNNGGTEKLHIIAGLLMHDEIGSCKIEEVFPSVDFHLTIFWVHGHRKPPSVHSEIIDYAILESLTDISPRNGWIMPEVSLEQLLEAQQSGNGNPILDSLYLRLKRMSDASKGTTTTRKSRRSPKGIATKSIQTTTTRIPSTTFPSSTTPEVLLPETTIAEKTLDAAFLECQKAALKAKLSGKVKKRFVDKRNDKNDVTPCQLMFGLSLENAPASDNFILTNEYSTTSYFASSTTDSISDISTSTEFLITDRTNDISTSKEFSTTNTYDNNSTPSEFINISITTDAALNETKSDDLSFLEEVGDAFGDRHHGILYLLFIIFIILILLCGISLLVYCLWPKYYHDEPHSRKPRSKASEKHNAETNTVGGTKTVERTQKTNSTESAEKKKMKKQQKQLNSSNKESASSNKKMDSNVNKMKSSDVGAVSKTQKSPVKSILKKSPLQKPKPASSHPVSSRSDRSQTGENYHVAIEIEKPISPAGITPLPSALSYAENTNMKFNDKKDVEAPPPELQPSGNNDPF